ELDMIPPDLAGQVRALQDYEFTSSEAREKFDALMDKLRQQLMQSYFNQMAGALSNTTPEQMQSMKDMFNSLNRMLEQREAGEPIDPSFEQFMEQFGQFFPGNPQSLDELLEQMAQQMAAMQSMLNSMTPEQRAQLQGLANQLLEDMDLRWQVERLGGNLRQSFPGAWWATSYEFTGEDPLDMAEAGEMVSRLGDIDRLEQLLSSAAGPGALAEADLDQVEELLGDDMARDLERLSRLARELAEAGLIDQRGSRLELTPRSMRRIGDRALADLFSRLVKDRLGWHETREEGGGHERGEGTKPYEWGDQFNLSIERTVRNAVARRGGGTPVRLGAEDFEVERTESRTGTSTVLALDLSASMPMRSNFLAAKKVAMALHALISSRFPRDYLGLVGFGELAREMTPQQLPEVSWDYTFGTNLHHALVLSRRMLSRMRGTRQILLITDGEPTAHLVPGGEPFFSYPPSPATIAVTLEEVARVTRDWIRINTFLLDATGAMGDFVGRMTKLNGGRAFYATPATLGDHVLVDFLEGRQRTRRRSA
ncbi:MAG: vWA domain-containing protein, partial [Acidimicrobiales bacterium]